MVKSHFQNIEIECWHHSGRVRSIGPSICLFRSLPESCGPLLRAIEELEVAGPPARRKLTFKPCVRPNKCSTLRLILSNESDDFHQIRIFVEGEIATIEVALDGLQQLREAIVRWHDGDEDFRLSPPQERNSEGDFTAVMAGVVSTAIIDFRKHRTACKADDSVFGHCVRLGMSRISCAQFLYY